MILAWKCLILFGIALMGGGCAKAPSASAPTSPRPGKGIVFEGVTVRQYRMSTPVLLISASILQWDEAQSVLEAPSGVIGKIDPSLWEGRQPEEP